MASNKSSKWINPSLLVTSLLLTASIVLADDIQTPGEPSANLLCISECGTCPVICSPPQSTLPPPPPDSGKYPPLLPTPSQPTPPTPPLITPSTPLLLPPEAPIVEFSPPPSYHAHPPPPPRSKSPPTYHAPSPPNIPYVIVPGGPAPPLGQGNNYPYPYYYFYSNEASLSNALPGFCFSVLSLILIHVLCSCT